MQSSTNRKMAKALQAMPGCTSLFILAQRPGAPGLRC